MIIALEGLDGVGKSTVGRILADAIRAEYVPLPPPKLELARAALYREVNTEARYAHYLSGVLAIADMAKKERLVVADRFLASAHAMHIGIKSQLAEALRTLPMPTPDLTFYLEADELTRRRRLQERGKELDEFERRLADDRQFRYHVAQKMREYEPTHVVNTAGREPLAVVNGMRRIWEEVSRVRDF